MATELIPVGTTTSAWFDFSVTNGAPVALYIKTGADGLVPSGVDFELAHKGPNGFRATLVRLNAGNILQFGNVQGVGDYSVRRLASSVSAGLNRS